MGTVDDDWLERLPKVELHLHLEGAIPYVALLELMCKYGGVEGDVASRDETWLRQKLTYRDFPHFIETWVWKNSFIREYEDFTFVAESVACDLLAQNIRYAEVFYSPRDFARHRLDTPEITAAIRRGLARVSGVEVALVADLIRDFGPRLADQTLSELADLQELGVIGVGIGGSEHEFPPEPFSEVFERARGLGFRTSAHAGEAAGPESVWGALRALRVDRVGHGTRAVEDQELMAHLATAKIPVELCPLSNVHTGVVPSIDEHPVPQFLEHGVLVCVNTDDPKMFHNSLADEFSQLQKVFGLTRDDVRALIQNAIAASWLAEQRKVALTKEFHGHTAWFE